jgi:hypothetical protein
MSKVLRWALEDWGKVLFVVTPTVALLLLLAFLAKDVAAWPFVGDLLESLAFVLIGVTLIELLLSLVEREKLSKDIERLREDVKENFAIVQDAATTGVRRISFPARDWTPKLTGHRKVVIAALRIRFVKEPRDFMEDCNKILDTGGEVTLVMADPRSNAVQLRYLEEPLMSPYGQATQGEPEALRNLAALLGIAYRWKEDRERKNGDVSKFKLKVAANYPSHAYYLLDDELYVYHYPFRARGFEGPLFQFEVTSEVGQFLCSCLDQVVHEAVPLDTPTYQDINASLEGGRLNDDVVLAAARAGGSSTGSPPSSTPPTS